MKPASVVRAPCARSPRLAWAENHLERSRENERAIRASMRRWQRHNAHGRSLGRGLSNADLVDRVSSETGASKTFVRYALSRKD